VRQGEQSDSLCVAGETISVESDRVFPSSSRLAFVSTDGVSVNAEDCHPTARETDSKNGFSNLKDGERKSSQSSRCESARYRRQHHRGIRKGHVLPETHARWPLRANGLLTPLRFAIVSPNRRQAAPASLRSGQTGSLIVDVVSIHGTEHPAPLFPPLSADARAMVCRRGRNENHITLSGQASVFVNETRRDGPVARIQTVDRRIVTC